MENISNRQSGSSVPIVGVLLLLAAATQAIYTGLSAAEMDVPRQLLWGSEGVLFTLMAAFAGAVLAQARSTVLGWSAITVAATLNVVQVGIGLTMFGPFFEAAGQNEAFAPLAGAVVAYSFMVYNAAKVLLGLAAVVFGMAKMAEGGKALGGVSTLVGAVALIANALSLALGRDFSGGLPIAGASGVAATLLLALCVLTYRGDRG